MTNDAAASSAGAGKGSRAGSGADSAAGVDSRPGQPATGNQAGSDQPDRGFADWPVGLVLVSEPHRMTEQRIIEFATEFDPQPFHTDPEAAAESHYGGLIASGWHTAAVMMRLLTTFLGPSSMGSPGVDELRWLAPVRPGDDLRLRVTVLEARPSSSRPEMGLVRISEEMLNQGDAVVMSQQATIMIKR